MLADPRYPEEGGAKLITRNVHQHLNYPGGNDPPPPPPIILTYPSPRPGRLLGNRVVHK